MSNLDCQPGSADKLGAMCDERGVNFAIFSANATKIELCLFDDDGKNERRIELPKRTGDIWHGYIPGLKAGQVYGYRVHGPHDPASGHLFNPNKLVLDPYAREIIGDVRWSDVQFDASKDNADHTLKARVTTPLPPKKIRHPHIPANKTVIYELHVKGFTMTDPAIPAAKRGTCEALGDPATIAYLKKLGITTIELLPVYAKLNEGRLQYEGFSNYWGYNTIGYFSLQPELGKREEFRAMVDKLHEAGIEVILDVVYNHTAEEGRGGPLLSFRGIDNASYYRLDPHDKRNYINEAGCGNTINMDHPQVRRMVIDSLAYWVEEFGVDGFRYDLATILGREHGKFARHAEFFKELKTRLPDTKHIAEPWDCSHDGYQLGNFPTGWQEWNGKFRDDVRRFWRGDAHMNGALATRLAGSSHEYDHSGRTPQASINFVTCHDGFTMEDLVSYHAKHNLANKEGNRDGSNDNHSANYGVEGPTNDPEINKIRQQQKRNMLTTLFLAQGTPMLLAGDEFGNTQHGNNNAYCQDNEIGWLNKDKISAEGRALTTFVEKLAAFRQEHSVLTQKRWLHGRETCQDGIVDLQWVSPDGYLMPDADWHHPDKKCFGMLLNEGATEDKKTGEKLLAVFNAAAKPVSFRLPELEGNQEWQREIDTSEPSLNPKQAPPVRDYHVPARSVVVFTQAPRGKKSLSS